MPNLTIVNNLDEAIHVSFFITAPTHWKNNLQPGERWTRDLPTLPLYFQARRAERTHDGVTYRSPEFCPEDSWQMGATIGVACAAGTASVVTAATSLLTGWEGGVLVAAPLMVAANAGGRRYSALLGQNAKLCEAWVWVPWFEHKEYSVRMVSEGQCGLWDVRANRQV